MAAKKVANCAQRREFDIIMSNHMKICLIVSVYFSASIRHRFPAEANISGCRRETKKRDKTPTGVLWRRLHPDILARCAGTFVRSSFIASLRYFCLLPVFLVSATPTAARRIRAEKKFLQSSKVFSPAVDKDLLPISDYTQTPTHIKHKFPTFWRKLAIHSIHIA